MAVSTISKDIKGKAIRYVSEDFFNVSTSVNLICMFNSPFACILLLWWKYRKQTKSGLAIEEFHLLFTLKIEIIYVGPLCPYLGGDN